MLIISKKKLLEKLEREFQHGFKLGWQMASQDSLSDFPFVLKQAEVILLKNEEKEGEL